MCMCMPVLLAEDSGFWAFAMLSQQGVRATLEGTDGLNSLSPRFTIQTDRERNKEPERQSTTERDLIIEMENKKKKNPLKRNLAASKLRRYQKIGSTKRQMLCQQHLVDERETEIDFLLVCPN